MQVKAMIMLKAVAVLTLLMAVQEKTTLMVVTVMTQLLAEQQKQAVIDDERDGADNTELHELCDELLHRR